MKIKTMTVPVLIAAVVIGVAALAYSELSGREEPAPTTTGAEHHGHNHDGHDHDHHHHDELVPAPTSTPDFAGIAAAAVDALSAYAQRELGYTEWFAQLEPHLHASAVDAYATVRPANIPPLQVEGEAVTTETSTDTYAVVYVPTSIGRYTVELRRADAASSWGVTRFQPPTARNG